MALILWTLVASLLFGTSIQIQTYPISLPGCPNSCGNMSIPYPFGTIPGCYLDDSFFISCNTTSNPPMAFLGNSNINVTEILAGSGQMRIWAEIARQCYDKNGILIEQESNRDASLAVQRFTLSNSSNKFWVVGCDTYGLFSSSGNISNASYVTGCISMCSSSDLADVANETCTGQGCCQTSIPRMAQNASIRLRSFQNHTGVSDFDPCSYAFVAEENAYAFNSLDLLGLNRVRRLPVILEWGVGSHACEEAKLNTSTYACKENSYCHDLGNTPGYICKCIEGYQGNPYLRNGCQDIDECKVYEPCTDTCLNSPGSYQCSCPWGYTGDGKKHGNGCTKKLASGRNIVIALVIGVGIGSIALFLGCYFLPHKVKRSLDKRQRDQNFSRNGGMLLQQQLSSDDDIMEKTKIFTSKEMKNATDHFNQSRILGQGGQGTVYKGMLDDGRIVAIKKSRSVDEGQLRQFINEVVVLSQINHRNIVKLVGCCLETKLPLLVYEYVPNGTLSELIHHDPSEDFYLTWKMRLQIAAESAGALAYLHSSSSMLIYHRDIKSSNILLDEKYRAKVADFGISRNISVDQTHLSTCHVQGTFGYLDPEYFRSFQFTDKSDVYSFGVVLVELLTSKKPILSSTGAEDHRSLATEFLSMMESSCLFDMLDPQVLKEAKEDEVENVASLASRCLNMIAKQRPTMKEVSMMLESIRSSQAPNPVEEVCLENDHPIAGEITKAYRRTFCLSAAPSGSGDSYSTDIFQEATCYSSNVILQDSSSSRIDVHPILPNTL